MGTREMKLIAHRGGRGFGTDNTLEAMTAAVRAGVRAIEIDVRSTADGRLLVCHDSTIWGRSVRRGTYDELVRLSPDRPLLQDVLEALAGWVWFNFEIKEANPGDVAEALSLYDILTDSLVTSFNLEIIERLKGDFPAATTGYLYRTPYGRERKLDRAVEAGASVLAPYFNSMDHGLIREAHGCGLEVCAWTVNDDEDFRKLHDWGADTVITDRYLEMSALLARLEGVQSS
jgi:glycerophosphoryl diester phosphodiesterase